MLYRGDTAVYMHLGFVRVANIPLKSLAVNIDIINKKLVEMNVQEKDEMVSKKNITC